MFCAGRKDIVPNKCSNVGSTSAPFELKWLVSLQSHFHTANYYSGIYDCTHTKTAGRANETHAVIE